MHLHLPRRFNAMIYFHKVLLLLLPLFTSTTAILLCRPSILDDVFGSSTPFIRQEIRDGFRDVITIDDCDSTIT